MSSRRINPDVTVEEPRKFLSREDILDSDDLVTEIVAVPEWGGDVIVTALSGTDRDAYEGELYSIKGGSAEYNLQNIRAKLSARSMVDERGIRLFDDKDVLALGLKSAAALDRVFSVAQRLSRLTNEDVKELTEQMGNVKSVVSGSA